MIMLIIMLIMIYVQYTVHYDNVNNYVNYNICTVYCSSLPDCSCVLINRDSQGTDEDITK